MGSWWFTFAMAAVGLLIRAATGSWGWCVAFIVVAAAASGIYLDVQGRRRK